MTAPNDGRQSGGTHQWRTGALDAPAELTSRWLREPGGTTAATQRCSPGVAPSTMWVTHLAPTLTVAQSARAPVRRPEAAGYIPVDGTDQTLRSRTFPVAVTGSVAPRPSRARRRAPGEPCARRWTRSEELPATECHGRPGGRHHTRGWRAPSGMRVCGDPGADAPASPRPAPPVPPGSQRHRRLRQ